MSVVETKSQYHRDVNNMLPKWFKHTRNIKCGRKIICVDQLYGWRGSDTGYYGSEELEDAPDFLDEVEVLPVQSEIKNGQLGILRKEAEEQLRKAREARPNFNILTDRAPTPDFSVTYIETSYSTEDDSVNKSQKNAVTLIDEVDRTVTDDATSGDNNSNNFGEPMEVDGSSYFRRSTCCQSQNMYEILNQTLLKENGTNVTYTIENNDDNKSPIFHTSENHVNNIGECEPILELKLDGAVIVEKFHEAKGNMMNPVQDHKDQHNTSMLDSEHVDEEDEIALQPINQKLFGYPAPLQATFDLSCIDKVDLATSEKSELLQISSLNTRDSRIPCCYFEKPIDNSVTHVSTSRPNNRTTVSFKTPKQYTRNAIYEERTVIRKQPAIATPLFKKRSIASTALRGTSTPVEGSAYVCPRYGAHHAALASHATQTGSGTPVSLHSRTTSHTPQLTPKRCPSSRSSRISCEFLTEKPSTPSRIPVPTSSLMAISQYGTPSPPLKDKCVFEERSKTELEQRLTSSMSSVTQIPLSRFAFEHLKSGGTPRPTSSTEKKWKKIAGNNSLLTVPKTPVTKTDITQMLVDNVARSGPACRRRPHPLKLLSPIGNLRFEKSSEGSNLSLKYVSPAAADSKEEMGDTQLVVIDSFDDDTMKKIVKDTVKLSVVEEQNVPSEEREIVFDTTANEYREQQKIPLFDTGNYFDRRRILSMLNESNMSVNTPGKEGDSVIKMNPSFSGDLCEPLDSSVSPVHIVAAKDENKDAAVLRRRKIVHSEEIEQGFRRSTRNRVAPIRQWLGEKPVYRRDQQGTYELVRVEEAVVKDPLYVKYNTIDMSKALQQQKREQKQHARARRIRKFDRACRDSVEKDAKTNE
ncbi:unnamed protein product [Litomosoides sigmodontis]|uniref:Uncharacterized protein n=1 Tax=Litomosoides sigmodontis TaxID=42156 RepID=A0A3P6UDU9_LITSI|nr:unnamed protein product [Litomosoides sigmodontis]